MGRKNLLTAKEIAGAGPGWHSDGGCLYLRVDHGADGVKRKRWVCRVTRDRKKRDFGVGSADRVSLKLARERRDAILTQLADGLDPVAEKRTAREARETAKRTAVTFSQAAEAAYKVASPGWKRGSTATATWIRTINKDCRSLHRMPVGEITQDHIWKVIEPFVLRGHLIAARGALGRIEYVLNCATANGWRSGDNPASWSIFQFKIPARANGAKKSHAMVAWKDMPGFMTRLRAVEDNLSAIALELIALTACRSNEVRGARWDEFDWDEKLWTVPASRMKRSVEFKVPLSGQALAVLKPLYETRERSQLVFPGPKPGKAILNSTLWRTMRRVTGNAATTHGLRASFATWASDHGVSDELVDMCLAHGKKSQTTAAYNRAENVERRRIVMADWGAFLDGKTSAKVVAIGSAKRGRR
jgi:integrase